MRVLSFLLLLVLHPQAWSQSMLSSSPYDTVDLAIDNQNIVKTSAGKFLKPDENAADAYETSVPGDSWVGMLFDEKNTIKAKDGSYYLRSGNLAADDTRLRVAKRQPDGFYEVSTYQITDGNLRRATVCKSPAFKRMTETKYECYFTSKDVCRAVILNAKALVKNIEKCEDVTKQIEKALTVGTTDLEFYSQREVSEIRSFVNSVIPGKKDKGLDVDFSPATMKRKARTRSAAALYADFNETLEQCQKFHPASFEGASEVKQHMERKKAPAQPSSR